MDDTLSAQISLGEALKKERKKKNFTLESISKKTNISLKSLQALENNDLLSIPSTFYLKNYIKNYLESIECNNEQILEIYQQSIQHLSSPSKGKNNAFYSKLRYSRFKNKNLFLSIFLFFILFCIVFGFIFIRKHEIIPTGKDISLNTTEFFSFPSNFTRLNSFNVDRTAIKLRIEVLENCWIQVVRGRGKMKRKTLEQVFIKGERVLIEGYEITVSLGNPSGVRLYINNKEFKGFQYQSKSEQLTITPENMGEILKNI